jgi:adhesin transport system outer membrane protein
MSTATNPLAKRPGPIARFVAVAALIGLPQLALAVTQCTDEAAMVDTPRGNVAKAASKWMRPVSLSTAGAAGANNALQADDPLTQLQAIVREASRRSAEVSAAQLEAQAANHDLDEAKGARYPQVAVSGRVGRTEADVDVVTNGRQTSLAVNVGAPLIDFGRTGYVIDWRSRLAGVAQLGYVSTREQVVLEAVSTAIERNRYRLQAQVYQQYARKMSCLVNVLEQIVAEDRGRASELVQARKTQLQAEISRDTAIAQTRQIESRLRKLIGADFQPGDGITVPLMPVPDLLDITRQLLDNSEIKQLQLQADALDSYAKAVSAGQKPQLNWLVSKAAGRSGSVNAGSWTAGVTLSYTIFNGFSDQAAMRAALKRADAARERETELIATRQARAVEVHDSATSAFSRAKSYAVVLRDSDRVRDNTFRQWSELGRRSLFDVMSAESDHYNLRIAYVNALHDGYEANAQLRSLGVGLAAWLDPQQATQ